jgi:hypothetical protein
MFNSLSVNEENPKPDPNLSQACNTKLLSSGNFEQSGNKAEGNFKIVFLK